MNRSSETHPSELDLIGHAHRPAGEPTSSGIDEHLRGCHQCEEKVRGYRALFDSMQSWSLDEAPQPWVAAATARIRELLRSGNEAEATSAAAAAREFADAAAQRATDTLADAARSMQQVVARLVLDSWAGAAMPGIRGVSTLQPRQLLYESPLGSVHLQIEPKPERQLEIFGQFLPVEGTLGPDPGRVALEVGSHSATRKMQPSGEFRFRSVPPGRAFIRIDLGAQVLELEPIQLNTDDD